MKVALQHCRQRHLQDAGRETSQRVKRIHHHIGGIITDQVEIDGKRLAHVLLACINATKKVLDVPRVAELHEVERGRRHRARRHRQARQPRLGNEFPGRGRGIEHRYLMAAISQCARNGDHAGGQAKVICRKHGDEKSGHSVLRGSLFRWHAPAELALLPERCRE